MEILLASAVGAIAMPWFSSRVALFAVWCVAAFGVLYLAMVHCIDETPGLAGVGCVMVALIAAVLVLAGIAVGIVRLVRTGGGRRPMDRKALIVASAIAYGAAVMVILVLFALGS